MTKIVQHSTVYTDKKAEVKKKTNPEMEVANWIMEQFMRE